MPRVATGSIASLRLWCHIARSAPHTALLRHAPARMRISTLALQHTC